MSHVCGYTGDILLNPHLPDFTQDCVCPTLLQIRPPWGKEKMGKTQELLCGESGERSYLSLQESFGAEVRAASNSTA